MSQSDGGATERGAGPLRAARGEDASAAVMAALYVMAFLSGAAALIYEIAWARMLALTFGSTTLSVAAVVAGFMGGMGIGAFGYQVLFKRFRRPLVLYGCLEIGIAATAALVTLGVYRLPEVFANLSKAVPPGITFELARFAFVFVILLVPSALMGATFPALCTILIQTARGLDRQLGRIYGLNTIGAAGGVLLVGFVLVERIGLQASTVVGNAINVGVGVGALVLAAKYGGEGRPASGVRVAVTAIPTTLPRWLTGIVLVGSGFATLTYEILWFRGLHYFVGNATYAISTVLIIFLAGLGLGALLLRRVVERGAPERDLALCQFAIGGLAMVAMACDWGLLALPAVQENLTIFADGIFFRPWWWRLFIGCVIAAVTLLPATLMMGLSFPLASRLYLGDVKRIDSRVGAAYLLANIGSILGAAVAGLVFLPEFGTIGGTKVTAVFSLLLGLLLLRWIPAASGSILRPLGAAAVVICVLAVVMPASLPLRGERLTNDEAGNIVFVEEGDLATVQVLEHPSDPTKLAMAIDGFKIGWSEGFRGTQVHRKQLVLAHLPMVIDPRVRSTLNVGLGSAATLDALASYPTVETLDCVEINEPVVRASRLFPESRVLDDPRVTVTVDDAVSYLLRSDKEFDLIISDGKQHHFFSGNATLLCREYYELALEHLSDRGMLVQWVPMAMLNEDFEVNLRTMCEVFPHVEAFFFPKWAILTVASPETLAGRPTMLQSRYDELRVRSDMDMYQIDGPVGLLAHWTAGRTQLEAVLGDGHQSTWDHMRLDFTAYKASVHQWGRAKSRNMDLLMNASAEPAVAGEGPGALRSTVIGRSTELVRRSFAAFYSGDLTEARRLAGQALATNPDDRTARMTQSFMRSRTPPSSRSP